MTDLEFSQSLTPDRIEKWRAGGILTDLHGVLLKGLSTHRDGLDTDTFYALLDLISASVEAAVTSVENWGK
jgi:hypothetical protein